MPVQPMGRGRGRSPRRRRPMGRRGGVGPAGARRRRTRKVTLQRHVVGALRLQPPEQSTWKGGRQGDGALSKWAPGFWLRDVQPVRPGSPQVAWPGFGPLRPARGKRKRPRFSRRSLVFRTDALPPHLGGARAAEGRRQPLRGLLQLLPSSSPGGAPVRAACGAVPEEGDPCSQGRCSPGTLAPRTLPSSLPASGGPR